MPRLAPHQKRAPSRARAHRVCRALQLGETAPRDRSRGPDPQGLGETTRWLGADPANRPTRWSPARVFDRCLTETARTIGALAVRCNSRNPATRDVEAVPGAFPADHRRRSLAYFLASRACQRDQI